jgi:dihydropteroate synthase
MGILNITADSFSNDGLLDHPGQVLSRVEKMVADGADVLDIGGETAGTGRGVISIQEEIDRTAPWIEKIRHRFAIPVSINSWRVPVVQAALEAGAVLINDIGGLSDSRLAELAVEHRAGLVIMHLRGRPKEPHLQEEYADLIQEMIDFFEQRIQRAFSLGLAPEQLLLDPGIDFAKQKHHNLQIMNRLTHLTRALPYPWLAAISRKTVLGEVLDGRPPDERDPGTVALTTAACLGGCHMVRVHHVSAMRDVVRTMDAIQTGSIPS